MLVRYGIGMQEKLAGSLVWVGEAAGESRTPVVAGAIDGGAYGRRPLVGGIDVAAAPFPCLTFFRGNSRFGLSDRTMTMLSNLLGVMSPLEDIVLKIDSVRGTQCLCRWLATARVASP